MEFLPKRSAAAVWIAILLTVVSVSFAFPDVFYYPFRVFTPGPGGVYGTWIGIVQTVKSTKTGGDRQWGQDPLEKLQSTSFAVVRLHLRPPVVSTLPHFFWRPSHEIAGSMDVYLPDGTHQHCAEQLGSIDTSGALQLFVYDPGKQVSAINEAEVAGDQMTISMGMCPLVDAPSVIFAGALTKSASIDSSALRAQLPARIAAFHMETEVENSQLASEWVGSVSVWDTDHQHERPSPDAAMRLTLTPVPGSLGSFTGEGEIHHAWGWTEFVTLKQVTIAQGEFDATGEFADSGDDHYYDGHGNFKGTFADGVLTLDQGGTMLLRVVGILHRGNDADYRSAITRLPKLQPGQYPR